MRSQALPQDGAIAPGARRRRLLGLTAFAAAAAGASLVTGRGGVAEAEDDRQLVGSWMVAVTPPGAQPGGPARVLVSFTPDGVALRTAPLQQAAPPALGGDKMFIGTTHGEWAHIGDREFGLTFVGFAFDDAGKFLATQRIRVAVRVDEASDSFTGPFKADFLAADGGVLASSGGTVLGTRIRVEPPY